MNWQIDIIVEQSLLYASTKEKLPSKSELDVTICTLALHLSNH